jgi:hypothetical protein
VLLALQHTEHGLLCCVEALEVTTKAPCTVAVPRCTEGKVCYGTKPRQYTCTG